MTAPLFDRIALLGIGLIGSSLALAIKRSDLAGHIAIYTRQQETLDRAAKLELGDSYHREVADAVCLELDMAASVTNSHIMLVSL